MLFVMDKLKSKNGASVTVNFKLLGLKSLLHQGLSEPEFYGDLVYKLKKIIGPNMFQRSLFK